MLIIDGHVHIYDNFDVETLFNSAYENFRQAAFRFGAGDRFKGIFLLADKKGQDSIAKFKDPVRGKLSVNSIGSWNIFYNREDNSIKAKSDNEKQLLIIPGRQIVSAEGMEVLSLLNQRKINDGLEINKTIEIVKNSGGIPIIPWGFGKWSGRRGRILSSLIDNYDESAFLLGDNGGRMRYWPEPKCFLKAKNRGFKILPGSDPMPIKSETERIGSYGFIIYNGLSSECPTRDLKAKITSTNFKYYRYGNISMPYNFVISQIMIRISAVTKNRK